MLEEVQLADHPFNAWLEAADPFSFDVDRLPAPFGGPTLMLTARQDHLCSSGPSVQNVNCGDR